MNTPQLPEGRNRGPIYWIVVVILVAFVVMALMRAFRAEASSGPGTPVYTGIPEISLVGKLQQSGVLPKGFVPSRVWIRKYNVGVFWSSYTFYAVCMTGRTAEQAVLTMSKQGLDRWLDGKVEQAPLIPAMCESSWEECWPGDPPKTCPAS